MNSETMNFKAQTTALQQLRSDCAKRQKKGLHFILAVCAGCYDGGSGNRFLREFDNRKQEQLK